MLGYARLNTGRYKLGNIDYIGKRAALPNVQMLVADRWKAILKDTEYVPIDIHTPMWLWSRGKFKIEL